jgi:hypothetical protein
MRSLLKLLVLVAVYGCSSPGKQLGEFKLQAKFEDQWWEMIEPPDISGFSSPSCVYFDSTYNPAVDDEGEVLYIEKGDSFVYHLSYFTRTEEGYTLSLQDAKVYIYETDDGYYTSKIVFGIFKDQIDLMPCSF